MRPPWMAAVGVLTLGYATVDMERIAMPDDAPPRLRRGSARTITLRVIH